MSSHPFDCSFALAELIDATEADTDLTVGLQLQQAGPDGLVSAAPAAWLRWLDQVAADGSHGHDRSLGREASADSDRHCRCSVALVASMCERKHPPKHTQERSVTPALGCTLAFDCAHSFDEATDDGEQQVRRPDSDQKPIHTRSRYAVGGGRAVAAHWTLASAASLSTDKPTPNSRSAPGPSG